MTTKTLGALDEVWVERERQDALHPYDVSDEVMLAVLVEEVGEVAKAITEGAGLRDEVVQVAAVAIKWLELKT